MSDIYTYINKAIRESDRPVFLEIGAARCEDTMRIVESIMALKPEAIYEYYAIEPDPRNVKSIKESRASQFVHLVPVAIGNACQRTKFNQSGGTNPQFGYEHTLSGSLKKPTLHLNAHPWCKFDTQTEVRMVTLDAFHEFFSLPHIDFIWCDVQGAEDMVLEGGMFALQHTRFFYTEYHSTPLYEGAPNASDIARILGPNWKLVEQWSNDVLFENTCYQKSQSLPQPTVA